MSANPLQKVKGPPEHLNNVGCRIAYFDGKGRGVSASRTIPIGTVIEISPVLLFSQVEYKEHGQHTSLDHYTFKWPDGRMALALGLGSIFNHSEAPNVSYHLDTGTESIQFVTTRSIAEGEELCIFYGHRLWFQDVNCQATMETALKTDDGWGGLFDIGDDEEERQTEVSSWSLIDGATEDVVPFADLPFTCVRLTPNDDQEDQMDAIRTMQAWVADIVDSRQISDMLKWIRKAGLEDPSLSHLKRIRKSDKFSSLLLAPLTYYSEPPILPDTIILSSPYVVTVPRNAALTQVSLALKASLWPTIYAPRKKWAPEVWSKGKVAWAWKAMQAVVNAAKAAKRRGELPIAAYVPPAYETGAQDSTQSQPPIIAHDIRHSTSHPVRHAVLSAVRAVADYRASLSDTSDIFLVNAPADSHSVSTFPRTSITESSAARNGSHYLLTSLTLFTTHEPCIMCSMALLHSRVKEVFYLVPMERTGGCGGLTCVPRLNGVNHRFGIGIWREGEGGISRIGLEIDDFIDA